ncbi:MAG: hypothetical protein KDB14_17525 [Planctomycetales bacterium]|nr:hypothetical protein [Planctomycetales bacterium]
MLPIARRLLTVICVLGTLELCTRCFAPPPVELACRDDQVGLRYFPSTTRPFYSHESKRTIDIRANACGLRGPDFAVPKPDNVVRVAVLGDSYIAAHALNDEECLTGQMAEILNQRPNPAARGTRWEVMNCGVVGSSTGQQLALYEEVVRKLEPDVVIVAVSPDDMVDNSEELSNKPIVRYRINSSGELERVPCSSARLAAGAELRRSRFYEWQQSKVNRLIREIRATIRGGEQEIHKSKLAYLTRESERVQRAWTLTSRILDELRKQTERDGAELIVAFVPVAEQVYEDYSEQLRRESEAPEQFDVQHPERRLREICQQAGITYLPGLAEQMRAALPRPAAFHFDGQGHLNAAGHRQLAEKLAGSLLEKPPTHSSRSQAERVTSRPADLRGAR